MRKVSTNSITLIRNVEYFHNDLKKEYGMRKEKYNDYP